MASDIDIYRMEAVQARRENWLGEPIVLAPPLAFLFALLSLVVLVAAALLLILGSYTKKIEITGTVVSVNAPRAASLTEVCQRPIVSLKASGAQLPVNSENLNGDLRAGVSQMSGGFCAEFVVNDSEVGLLKPGMVALIKFDAFPYQRFGQVSSTINAISNVIQPTSSDSSRQGRFRVWSGLGTGLNESTLPLRVGMTAKAQILIETRPIYKWLLAPLFNQGDAKGA